MKRECHIMRMLDFEVEGQWWKGGLVRSLKEQVEPESMRDGAKWRGHILLT